ncbi:TPA: hypothetical protein JBJ19_11765 [Legionella pneumophila]|nr:hypothetical protein [Legionella pneumophila]HAU1605497.1 hypothetical protein [Legionella pneumophila]HAU1847644.1 hypothetical protein [Legionella pneumophila]
MSNSKTEVDKAIRFFKDQKKIEEYTERCLENPELTPREKMIIVHFNQHKRLNIIAKVQQHTYKHLFQEKPNEFFTKKYHYDWWIFPMHVPKEWMWEQRNYDASINLVEAQTLLHDKQFTDTYINSISMYLAALKKHSWNNYPVRYARMLHSLSLFLLAARNLEVIPEVYSRLYEQAQDAIAYAKEYILADNKDYDLLTTGYKATLAEIEKYAPLDNPVPSGAVP